MSSKVTIGNVYSCEIDGTFVPVRIDAKRETSENSYRGTNLLTGSPIRINGDALKGSGLPEAEYLARKAKEDAAGSTTSDAPPADASKPTAKKGKKAEKASKPKAEKKAAKATDKPAGTKTPKAKAERQPAGPRPSLINAAVLVLSGAKKPMKVGDIIATAQDRKLWTPGEGKTPDATLYAAMLTDKHERFNRPEKGLWELTEAGKATVPAVRKAFAAQD